MSADAFHITSPSQEGEGAAFAMRNALLDANIDKNLIEYINAHGTSTPAGDIAETLAIKSVFENSSKNLVVSSTKSMTGHLLGAAGAIESIASILAVTKNIVPPTINLDVFRDGVKPWTDEQLKENESPRKPTKPRSTNLV